MCASLCGGGGVSVKGGLCPGGFCQEVVPVKRGSLSRGSLSRGSLSGGSLSREGPLSRGVSVQREVSVHGGLCQGDPTVQ